MCDPVAIILDLVLGGQEAWEFLIRLKRDERSRNVPVIIVSALPHQEKGLALGADAYLVKPVDRRILMDTINGLQARTRPAVRVLAIDDEAMARYLVRQCLPVPAFEVTEASSGEEGLERARAEQPDVIVLDLIMPGLDGRACTGRASTGSSHPRHPGRHLDRRRPCSRRGACVAEAGLRDPPEAKSVARDAARHRQAGAGAAV